MKPQNRINFHKTVDGKASIEKAMYDHPKKKKPTDIFV